VDGKDRPIVGGRLFATTSVDLTLDQSDAGTSGPLQDDDEVVATIRIVAFSSVPGGTASASTAGAGTPVAAPATTPPAATAGSAQSTATPSGGSQ